MTTSEVARVFDTILSIPGMSDTIKLDLKISRQNVLLLNSVIERGINAKDPESKTLNLVDTVPKEILKELSDLGEECLKKAGLIEVNEKLGLLKNLK